jgi:hypothetical protein
MKILFEPSNHILSFSVLDPLSFAFCSAFQLKWMSFGSLMAHPKCAGRCRGVPNIHFYHPLNLHHTA